MVVRLRALECHGTRRASHLGLLGGSPHRDPGAPASARPSVDRGRTARGCGPPPESPFFPSTHGKHCGLTTDHPGVATRVATPGVTGKDLRTGPLH